MLKKDKVAEISRVCAGRGIPDDARMLIRWLGVHTIQDDDFRATIKQIVVQCFKSSENPSSVNRVKAAMLQARRFLIGFYRTPQPQSKVWIALPKDITKRRPHVRRPGRLALTFNDGSSSPAITSQRAKLKGPANLWEKMVHARSINEISLLYEAPVLEVAKMPSKRLWAGSGEVKAAHLIGECTSQLVPRYPVAAQPWSDFGEEELERKRQSLIILGCAVGEPKMRRLRERGLWLRQQQFHFEHSANGSFTYIRKGSLERPARGDKKFRYATRTSQHPETDWALVSFFKDDYYSQTLIAMQGISTVGTLAAAQFICTDKHSAECLRELRQRGITPQEELPAFEMLLKVEVMGSIPKKISVEAILRHDEMQ